uniref:RING-type domain-containing protein n=1 Tax=Tetraodon nigroviridis TaxID=99883 RepID=H3CEH1_TETNG
VCSIWHVSVDALPEWILSSVHQAQWTVGKLNCQNCSARLGGFDFIHHFACPCGQDAAVHLNKSRVDPEHKQRFLMVQPRMIHPKKEQSHLLKIQPQTQESESVRRPSPVLQSPRVQRRPAKTASCFPLALCTASVNRGSAVWKMLPPSGPPAVALQVLQGLQTCLLPGRSAQIRTSTRARQAPSLHSAMLPAKPLPLSFLQGGVPKRVICCSSHWRIVCLLRRPRLTARTFSSGAGGRMSCHYYRVQMFITCTETQHVFMLLLQPGSNNSNIITAKLLPNLNPIHFLNKSVFLQMQIPNKLSKRERNSLKGLRRKQRKKERWLHSRLDFSFCFRLCSQAEELLQSREEEAVLAEEEEREGLTCAVCLDIYLCPRLCRPCGHSFCEPCLRTIANNRPLSPPCPLCRTLISHTDFNKELDQTAQTFFPRVYCARKENFRSSACAKWPLPSTRQSFCTFWREQRRAARTVGLWRFHHHGVYSLAALDRTNMHAGLFNICLFILYTRSASWILFFFFFSVLVNLCF